MNQNAKEILDLRLAKGELSEGDYRRKLEIIRSSARAGESADIPSRLKSMFGAIKEHINDNVMIGIDRKPPPALSETASFDVTDDFRMFRQHYVYKGQQVPYKKITRLDYIAQSDTVNAVNTSVYRLTIISDGMDPVNISSMTMFIGRSAKGKRIANAYRLLSQITFQQRMQVHIDALTNAGYTTVEGVSVFANGDVVKGHRKANLKDANRNSCLLIGTAYSSWLGVDRANDPYEVIVGNGGTGLLSSRVRFRLTQNQDIALALLGHLSQWA